jgi:hypothetical protein
MHKKYTFCIFLFLFYDYSPFFACFAGAKRPVLFTIYLHKKRQIQRIAVFAPFYLFFGDKFICFLNPKMHGRR